MQGHCPTAPQGQGGLSTLHHMSDLSEPSATAFLPWQPDAWLNRGRALHDTLMARTGLGLGTPWQGDPVPVPKWGAANHALARELGWPEGWHADAPAPELPRSLQVLAGNAVWPGMAPFASVYSGHQFGVWAGQLGDGRAMSLGELHTAMGPQELQLKGAGATPYSRRADGRAVLRSSIREYLCSEAMHGLGIPTTRALSLVASPLPVRREGVETAAVVCRVAPSFLRFGHFEHYAHSDEPGATQVLQALVDHVLTHHRPNLLDAPDRALALLDDAVGSTAELMAAWQSVGFCHGVMNTDNMSILGLTIDYGPFGFLDGFNPDHICNHSDDRGRYSWNNQPQIGFWNLRALAQALLPLVPGAQSNPQPLIDVLQTYEQRFPQAMRQRWRAKLGLATQRDDDGELAVALLQAMAKGAADFTITFRRLCRYRSDLPPQDPANAPVRDMFLDREAFDAWAQRYSERLKAEGSVDAERAERMGRANPAYVLRNHLAEAAIQQARKGDFSEIERLHRLLQRPFDDQPGCEADADFPPAWASSIEVSCSS